MTTKNCRSQQKTADEQKTAELRSAGAEAFAGAGLCFGGLFFAALWGGGGFECVEESSADGCDLIDGLVEGGFVCFGGLVEAADLPDELQGGVADLLVGHGGIEVEEVFDVSAHAGIIGMAGSRFHTRQESLQLAED